jgi:hypothetical protein
VSPVSMFFNSNSNLTTTKTFSTPQVLPLPSKQPNTLMVNLDTGCGVVKRESSHSKMLVRGIRAMKLEMKPRSRQLMIRRTISSCMLFLARFPLHFLIYVLIALASHRENHLFHLYIFPLHRFNKVVYVHTRVVPYMSFNYLCNTFQ